MKIVKFLLTIIYVYSLSFQSSIADDAKMKKGLEIFNEKAGCAGCHALKAAGAEANIGPNLDMIKPDVGRIVIAVTNGIGVMPAYEGILTSEEIEAVSFYVSEKSN